MAFAISGCKSQEENAEEIKVNYITHKDYNLYSLNGDDVLDSTSQGSYWDTEPGDIIRFSTSNGFGGETWFDQIHVAKLLTTAMNNLAYYTDLNIEYIGHFSDPEVASNSGSIVNLTLDGRGYYVPYYASARAYFPDDANPYSAGDIVFNSALNNLLSNAIRGDQYFFILFHELGYSLGLKHPHDDGGTGKPTFDEVNLKSFDYDLFTVMSYNDSLNNYADSTCQCNMLVKPYE